ncbi:uncharacterized protein EV422DRAFT_198007 [Fimicolochytrium jonesii]|uniref:uncharacterized protein n=1 Tax=Fimicolochytrium jonesii TaxID=1396493 RepID=UPI0022FE3855|nr:uncharacterized protein EV422DRAFT_198007 [Fimicolochytrium jonesii]KAI8817915.1 hypothetical protein EV422DRAFT_198007 [Fimicolochytrium jonesii]
MLKLTSFAVVAAAFISSAAALPRGRDWEPTSTRNDNQNQNQWPKLVPAAPDAILDLSTTEGTQNYICDAYAKKWSLYAAEAVLVDSYGQKVGKHYFVDASPYWHLYSDDSYIGTKSVLKIPPPSSITGDWWSSTSAPSSHSGSKWSQPSAPAAPSTATSPDIPWLVTIRTSGSESGTMSQVGYVVRTYTQGGVAPAIDECVQETHGKVQKVPYEARYLFAK